MEWQRYAIYWLPAPGSPLGQFGRDLFGGCPDSGDHPKTRKDFGLESGLAARAVEKPRRYGFHGTVKAPFRPAAGVSAADIAGELERFCARRRRIRSGALVLQRFPRYLALCPADRTAEIGWLASECAVHFDRFRAPLDDEERARRGNHLTELERLHFEQFGYPYIFSLFRFHVSLAGPLSPRELDAVAAGLRPELTACAAQDFILADLCLLGDPGGGAMFRTIGRFPLAR